MERLQELEDGSVEAGQRLREEGGTADTAKYSRNRAPLIHHEEQSPPHLTYLDNYYAPPVHPTTPSSSKHTTLPCHHRDRPSPSITPLKTSSITNCAPPLLPQNPRSTAEL